MSEPNIKDLLKLYEEGKATEEQRKLVEAYLLYHQQQSPKRAPDEKPNEDPLRAIMEKIRLSREQEAGKAPVYEIGGAAGYPMEEPRKRRRIGWMAAASIALIITAGILWKQSTHKHAPETIASIYKTIHAAPGKTIHLLLSDSSEVWLNAGAILRYPQPFNDTLRKLELLDGEAFFQVHPDANRGFVVHTDHLLTKVLGTSFNVKAYRESQQMSVTVTTGKVAVIPGKAPVEQGMTLLPDQEARYNNVTGQLVRSAPASARASDWKNGSFNFMEESLGDIAIELEHYFNVHVGFKYPSMKKYTISASFRRNTPLKDMLGAICLLNQNHFTQTDAQTYVIH